MRILIGLILLAFPIAELILLVSLGHRYGGWLLLYLVVIGYLGLQLIRTEKQMLSVNMMRSLELGANPLKAMLGSARNMVAGILLLIPGVLSDVIAAILLLIPVRQAQTPSGNANAYQANKGGDSARYQAANDDIIEGEFTEIKEPDHTPFATNEPPTEKKIMAKVTIQSSGQAFEVRPSQTVLQAAIEEGINLPYGCRNGACGACKAKVLSGKVMHDDYQGSALSDAELAAGNALLCCARPLEDLVIQCREMNELNGIKPRILPVRVLKKTLLASDVLALYLQLPGSERLQFFAGQYIEFILKEGKRRAFSIANAPQDDATIELHLRHIAGGEFTEFAFNALQEKAILRIEGPFGNFYLREDSDKPIIFVAGGTGFAPIKGIIEHMIAQGVQRELILYRGGRLPEDIYLDALCQSWRSLLPTFKYIPVVSGEFNPDVWLGRTGLVHQAVLDDFKDLSAHQVYVCGAPGMVEIAHQSFIAQGLPADEFFSDAFTFAVK